MNFSFKPSPHTSRKMSTSKILNIVLISLIFVALWGIYNQYVMFGSLVAFHGFLIIIVTCVMAIITHILFYMLFDKLEDKKFKSFSERITSNIHKVNEGAPLVTALILALCLPTGTPLYVAAFSVVFAEVFAKLLFGGFGQNIFNPAGVGFIFASVAFGTSLIVPPLADATTGATSLNSLSANRWLFAPSDGLNYIELHGGFFQMLLGSVPGAIGETSRLATLIALVFMVYHKVLDWAVPVFYLGTVFIISWLFGIYNGLGFWYPILHILSGGLIFGAVFMATDPVTNPINRQGRIIYSILLGMLTLLLRFQSNHPEGAIYSIIFMNMFVPVIDKKTANLTTANVNKKWLSILITFVISIILIFGFTFNMQL